MSLAHPRRAPHYRFVCKVPEGQYKDERRAAATAAMRDETAASAAGHPQLPHLCRLGATNRREPWDPVPSSGSLHHGDEVGAAADDMVAPFLQDVEPEWVPWLGVGRSLHDQSRTDRAGRFDLDAGESRASFLKRQRRSGTDYVG